MTLGKDVSLENGTEIQGKDSFEDDASCLDELFDLAAASFRFNGQQVLAKLSSGEPIATAAAIPPDFLEFLYARAHKWFAAGHFSRAEQVFQTLCLADANSPDYWGGLGLCLAMRSAWNEALLAFDKAIELKADWGAMHFHRLEALIHLEDWDRASEQYQQFKASATDSASQEFSVRADKYNRLIAFRLHHISNGANVS